MGRSGLIGAFWCVWVWYDCIRGCLDLVFVVLAGYVGFRFVLCGVAFCLRL